MWSAKILIQICGENSEVWLLDPIDEVIRSGWISKSHSIVWVITLLCLNLASHRSSMTLVLRAISFVQVTIHFVFDVTEMDRLVSCRKLVCYTQVLFPSLHMFQSLCRVQHRRVKLDLFKISILTLLNWSLLRLCNQRNTFLVPFLRIDLTVASIPQLNMFLRDSISVIFEWLEQDRLKYLCSVALL